MQGRGFKKINALIKERKNIILKGGDLLSQKGFTQVPNHVLESKKLSPGAKLAYAMLLKYAWQNDYCFPGQDKLAVDKAKWIARLTSWVGKIIDKYHNVTNLMS
jgi:hypothetical protein